MENSASLFLSPARQFVVRLSGVALLLAAIAATAQYSYVLFHSLVEIARIVVILAVAAVTWNLRSRIDSPFLLLTGLAYPALGILELLHALAYKGMGIFPSDANLPTQLWIALRAYESVLMLIAVSLLGKSHPRGFPMAALAIGFFAVGALLAWLALTGRFPDCFVEGRGLTDFKVTAEYVIAALFALTFVLLWRRRSSFPPDILPLVLAALLFDILAGLAFTQYASVYGKANLVGHLLLLSSTYCLYRALLSQSILKPLDMLFRQLNQEKERLAASEVELRRMNAEIKQTQSQLLQTEKLASVGRFAAGIAHEINNPIGFVRSNLHSMQRYADELLGVIAAYEAIDRLLPADGAAARSLAEAKARAELSFLKEDVIALVNESIAGVGRVERIVQDLREFCHPDDLEWEEADLNSSLDVTLNLIRNAIEPKTNVIKAYGELPSVYCVSAQLNHVFMNLLINAVQAIEQHGTITLRTGANEQSVWVEIADTGQGISREDLPRIFDPFFTTKPVGKGTGLGLSIAYGVVKKHGGAISVSSELGKGSTFRVSLPR